MSGAVVFDPVLPWPLLAAMLAIAGVLAIVGLIRGSAGAPLRLVAAALLVLLLARPSLRETETTPLPDIALLLVDQSASESLDQRDAAAEKAADDIEKRLSGEADLEIRRVDVTGTEKTELVAALRRALGEIPRDQFAGAFLLTDGQAHDANEVQELRLDAPVHLLLTGRPNERDRKLTLIAAPRYGIVKESVDVAYRIDEAGPGAQGGSAPVEVRIDGEVVSRRQVRIGEEDKLTIPLDRPGQVTVELSVSKAPGELTTRNNSAAFAIEAVRDRLRVLLVSGEPHPGERVWRNLLKSDPAVDLIHFTILRPIEKYDPTPQSELALIRFPQDELFVDKLNEFDVIIFDRYTYRGVLNALHFDNIARYVENGGAMLIASGPEFSGPASLAQRTNLSFVLPAVPSGPAVEAPFRPELSEEGKKHPVTANLPEEKGWGRWLRTIPVRVTQGATLMTGAKGLPLLVVDRVGKGRVALLNSDHVWLWARGYDGGGPHRELLRRLVHWLMKEPELEEEALSAKGGDTDLVIHRRTMSDTAPDAHIEGPDGYVGDAPLTEEAPGRWTARVPALAPGYYRVSDDDLYAIAAVGAAAPPEFSDVVATPARLQPLVDATGGGVYDIRTASGAVSLPDIRRVRAESGARGRGVDDRWAGLIRRDAKRIDAIRERPLAPAWLWLIGIAAALALAWRLEGVRKR